MLFVFLKPGTTIDKVRSSCWHVSTKLTQATYRGIFFLEIRDTRKDSLGEEYESWTMNTYIPKWFKAIYFLERKDGESFDIGEDEDLNKKLAARKQQLKAEGKGNRPHRADPLDENQVEKLWTTGAVGLKTPCELLHLMW